MTFWDLVHKAATATGAFVLMLYNGVKEHRTKWLGGIAGTWATLIFLKDQGMLEGLATAEQLKWLAVVNMVAGFWTAKVGWSNTTAERIAQSNATNATAEATTAAKIDAALHTKVQE